MTTKLYVGNLAYSVRDNDLQQQFSSFGNVISAQVMMERGSDRSKGFGFVEMSTADEAEAAIEGMHEQTMGGRNLTVNIARPREEGGSSYRSNSGGGGYRGNGGGYGGNGGGYGGGNRY
ncbi:RNA recognition motif domain-containing protein [Comamonas sp. NoAH]|uniref:RNA recognition motif domain-containing protein n=1 Tax=Comamonas halotolerans TaxID=3041496 RepID=UPI0024E099E9|nr:RNA-binding protein [Comamonas sp. NoAH]